jgi:hypothetical protein
VHLLAKQMFVEQQEALTASEMHLISHHFIYHHSLLRPTRRLLSSLPLSSPVALSNSMCSNCPPYSLLIDFENFERRLAQYCQELPDLS